MSFNTSVSYVLEKVYICTMINKQLYKGSLIPIIMKLLKEHGKMYGYQITQEVKTLTKGKIQITEGALYPTLHKLEAEGLLDVEVQHVGNRMRKYYKLTENGVRETQNRLEELENFLSTIRMVLTPKTI